MRTIGLRRLWLAAGFLASAAVLQGQFLLLNQDENTVRELVNGSTLTMDAEGVGGRVTTRVTVTFDGPTNSTATVNEPTLTGSTAFQVQANRTLPHQLTPGSSIDFTITFQPGAVGPFSARLTLNFTQSNPGQPVRAVTILLNLTGRVADYTLSYQLPGGNELLLPGGGTVPFPDTERELTTNATITVTNRGSGPGTFASVAIRGAGAFEATGLQLLPVTVQPGANVKFGVAFTPPQGGDFAGSLQVNFGLGSRTVSLQGRGVEAVFTYQLIGPGGAMPVQPGGAITLPPVDVGIEAALTIRATNTGTATGRIATIASSGSPFSLRSVPLLPLDVDPGGSFEFLVIFTPQDGKPVTGQLRVGQDTFVLRGDGRGSEFTYSWTLSGVTREVAPRGTVLFPETSPGASSTVEFSITNTGDVEDTLLQIGLTGASDFSAQHPGLPTTLQPGAAVTLTLVYRPRRSGPQSATLAVNGVTFTLSGVGGELPELPLVTFSPGGLDVAPATQGRIGLTLASPYPVEIEGELTLSFESEVFTNDPVIQFAAGGRRANFRIPANTTQAIFSQGQPDVAFQTGTVAGRLTFRSTFTTGGGQNDITPESPPETTLTVRRSEPVLRSVTVGSLSGGGFSILVTGYATPRSITSMQFDLTAASGATLGSSQLSADVTEAFRSWYSSQQSANFGSQFTATVNFNLLEGSVDDIASVSVQAVNEFGTSQAFSVSLQ